MGTTTLSPTLIDEAHNLTCSGLNIRHTLFDPYLTEVNGHATNKVHLSPMWEVLKAALFVVSKTQRCAALALQCKECRHGTGTVRGVERCTRVRKRVGVGVLCSAVVTQCVDERMVSTLNAGQLVDLIAPVWTCDRRLNARQGTVAYR